MASTRKVVSLFKPQKNRAEALAHLFLARDAHITAEQEVLKALIALGQAEAEPSWLYHLRKQATILEESCEQLRKIMRKIESYEDD